MILRLRNGRLPDHRLVDIEVSEGIISAIGDARTDSENTDSGKREGEHSSSLSFIDLGGWLVLPALAEPHAHLDKALTSELVPNPTGDLLGAITAWTAASKAGLISSDGIVERAIQAMDKLVVSGVTAVRTHVNVVEAGGGQVVTAVRKAAAHFDDVLDVQVVGLVGSPLAGAAGAGNRAALASALEAGIDLVGGCPHLEEDGQGVIDVALSAAAEAGLGVDLHVDEMLDPNVLTLRMLARTVLERGFEHAVAASHCVTLGMQTPAVQAEVAALVAEAGIAIIALPQTNLFLQGRQTPTATPRGITAVKALTAAGALVAAGGDNVQDPFNVVGRSDPLETASLMVMAGHQLPETAYEMVSSRPRLAMGLPAVEMLVGDPADLLVIDAPSIRGAIADAPMSRRVFRRGRLVASVDHQAVVHRSS